MPSEPQDGSRRLSTEALVVAYAMSRLDTELLAQLGFDNWKSAFAGTSTILAVPHNSMKLLRDEFDVFFDNGRRGWVNRPPHPSRVAILREFENISDEALIEVVRRTLAKDTESIAEIMEIVSQPSRGATNVAERLLTGKKAEEYFVRACDEVLGVSAHSLIDMRHQACGFDFQSTLLPGIALEVKGLRDFSGRVLFTDREWSQAREMRADYWAVIIGNLQAQPCAKVYRDPYSTLPAQPRLIETSSVICTATASVA